MTPVFSKDYVFDPRPNFPFLIVARRYWIGELHPDANDHDIFSETGQDMRTLVFLHGNAGHKELWGPPIQRLFETQQASTGSSVRFRDLWSLDMPNHGDSAILNKEILCQGYETFPWEILARGVHSFLAGLGTGVDVDFSKRRLGIVGHSMGGIITVLTSTHYPFLKISSLHLIEPFFTDERGTALLLGLSEQSVTRQEIWRSSEEAFQTLKTRRTFRGWDERSLRILVTDGLRPLPTTEFPDKNEGMTSKCTRKQQAATYKGFGSVRLLYRSLPHVLKEIPTHIMFGEIFDFSPSEWQQDVLHVASGGISNFASVTMVPNVGHLVLETHPDLVGDVIWKQVSAGSPTNSTAVAPRL